MAAPVLTPTPMGAQPWVDIRMDTLPAGTTAVSIWRTVDGRESIIRDAYRIVASGAVSRIDYEAPVDADATYRVQYLGAGGVETGWSESATTHIQSPPEDGFHYVWVHNPLDPRTAVRVAVHEDGFSSITQPTPGRVSWPVGRRVGLVQAGRRRGMVGIPLHVVTTTREDGDKLEDLLGSTTVQRLPILCVRPEGSLRYTRLPAVFFAGVLEQTAYPDMTLGTDTVQWRMTGDEVDAPVPSLVMPLLRRIDVKAFYTTRQAVRDGNQSRFALSRRYEIAGAAG